MSNSFEEVAQNTKEFDDNEATKRFWAEIRRRGGVRKALDHVLPIFEKYRPKAARSALHTLALALLEQRFASGKF